MEKLKNKYYNFFALCFIGLSLLFFVYNLTSQIANTIIFTSLSVVLLVLGFKYKTLIIKSLNKKYIRYFILFVPVILRFSLLLLNYPDPVSDEGTFYNTASAISLGNVFNQKYVATFPYLYGYIKVLSVIFKTFGISRTSVILFNIILDIIGAVFAYKTMHHLYDKKAGLITLLIWLYNPLNIIWCSRCLPIIIVNTLFIIAIYFFSKLIGNFKSTHKYIVFSILTGIMLGVTNIFRPIMIIFILTIILYYIYLIVRKEKIYKLFISFILILIPYKLIGHFNNVLVEKYTGYEIEGSASGWTIYVGSNYDSYGQWFLEPEFNEQINSIDFSPNKLHTYFLNRGVENYKKNGLKNINLIYQKGEVLSGFVNRYTYNQFVSNSSINLISVILKIYINFYWFFILNVMCLFSRNVIKYNDKQMLIFIILILGLFSSNLLVEVSPRYFTPIFVPLTLIGGYYVKQNLNNDCFLYEEVKYDKSNDNIWNKA